MKRPWPGLYLLLAAFALYLGTYLQGMTQRRAAKAYHKAVAAAVSGNFRTPVAGARDELPSIRWACGLQPRNAYFRLVRSVLNERSSAGPFHGVAQWKREMTTAEQLRGALGECWDNIARARAASPGEAMMHHTAGWFLFAMDQPDAALASLRRAAAMDPRSGLFRVSLGLLEQAVGREDEAYGDFASAVALCPSLLASEWYESLRAQAPERAAQVARIATDRVRAQLAADADGLARARLAQLEYHQGRHNEALALASEVTRRMPRLPRPWILTGEILRQRGPGPAMERAYLRAIAVSNGFAEAAPYARLAEYYETTGRAQAALDYYEDALRGVSLLFSDHAYEARVLYRLDRALPDDVVPHGLLAYCSPRTDPRRLYEGLARVYRKLNNVAAADDIERTLRRMETH